MEMRGSLGQGLTTLFRKKRAKKRRFLKKIFVDFLDLFDQCVPAFLQDSIMNDFAKPTASAAST